MKSVTNQFAWKNAHNGHSSNGLTSAGCKYLNFSRSTSEMELIARKIIQEMEGENKYPNLTVYADPESTEYHDMLEKIREKLNFTSLRYNRLDDMIDSVGIDPSKLCTYCWDGRS